MEAFLDLWIGHLIWAMFLIVMVGATVMVLTIWFLTARAVVMFFIEVVGEIRYRIEEKERQNSDSVTKASGIR